MRTACDTETGLVRAVCAVPDDDLSRLAYADWLDENAGTVPCGGCEGDGRHRHKTVLGSGKVISSVTSIDCITCSGTGSVPDGRAARAEFVRGQIALARCGPEHHRFGFGEPPDGGDVMRSVGPDYWEFFDGPRDEIKTGDRADVRRHRLRFDQKTLHKKDKVFYGLVVTKITPDADGVRYVVKRDDRSGPWGGAELKKRTAELLAAHATRWLTPSPFGFGVVQRGAGQIGWAVSSAPVGLGNRYAPAAFARGFVERVWINVEDFTDPVARNLFAAHPVTGLVFADREPAESRGGWSWYGPRAHPTADPARLSFGLWNLIPHVDYPTRDAAVNALSLVVVNHGRRLAGLGDLP